MRDDLYDAWHAVEWAAHQTSQMQERFLHWQRRQPYSFAMETKPGEPDWKYLVAYPKTPLDPLIYGDFGAILNSTRTALDLTMSALLIRNGQKPDSDAQFPIRKDEAEFYKRIEGFEAKGWVVKAEADILRKTKAYKGGDHVLFHLHKLDILRKHERLIEVNPVIAQANLTAFGPGIERHPERLEDKTVLYRFPASYPFQPMPGNTLLTSELLIDEPEIVEQERPAITALNVYRERVRAIVLSFNT